LRLINSNINTRVDLLSTLKTSVYYIDNKIDDTESSLVKLNEELKNLKSKYIEIAWHAYKYKTAYNKLTFLFSADGINQAYQRMRYLDQISTYIRKEADRIKKVEEEKNTLLGELKKQKATKKKLLNNEQTELAQLEIKERQQKKIQNDLKSKEKQLRAAIRKKEKEKRIIAKKIQSIIEAEISKENKSKTGETYALTPSEKKLTNSFTANKGKLPWPTKRGIISETFGVHKHPTLRKVKTKNNGIDILTQKNSSARAVFNGKVISVQKISNTNKVVIIKHGEFFTVYSNLDKIYVNKGDYVTTKEELGQIHTTLDGKTELHFEILKGATKQNPIYWIVKK